MWSTVGLATARRACPKLALAGRGRLAPTGATARIAVRPVSLWSVLTRGFAESKPAAVAAQAVDPLDAAEPAADTATPTKKPRAKTTKKAASPKKTTKADGTTKATQTKAKTTIKEAAPKKAAAKKPVVKKVLLTPEQKEANRTKRKEALRRSKAVAERQAALLDNQPVRLAQNPRALNLATVFQQARREREDRGVTGNFTQEEIKEIFTRSAKLWTTMSTEEQERYIEQGRQNKIVNDAAYKKWVESYTPLQTSNANAARRRLNKPMIKDERHPRQPPNAYSLFVSAQFATLRSTDPGFKVQGLLRDFGVKWKSMSEDEKRPYFESAAVEMESYQKAINEVFGGAKSVRLTSPRTSPSA